MLVAVWLDDSAIMAFTTKIVLLNRNPYELAVVKWLWNASFCSQMNYD